MNDTKTAESSAADNRMEKRDGEMYVALGMCIVAVGVPVVIGTYWAVQSSIRAAIVNFVCGAVLLLIGTLSLVYGRVILARNKKRT